MRILWTFLVVAVLAAAFGQATPAQAASTPLSAQQQAHIERIERYFGDLKAMAAHFLQVSSNGRLARGRFYLWRPGRMRFEYDPPSRALVIAGGGMLAIFDPVSNEPPTQYPLQSTPLNLILQPDVDFARSNMVIAHTGDDTATRILAQDPDQLDLGTIELVFSPSPVELRQWIITNKSGAQTTVILGALEERDGLSSFLFNIPLIIEERLK